MNRCLLLFLLLIAAAMPFTYAQDDEGQPPPRTPQPLALGETVTATFANRIAHTVELEAAQTVYLDVVSEMPVRISVEGPFFTWPLQEGIVIPEPDENGLSRVEFNAPVDDTYRFHVRLAVSDPTAEDATTSYTLTVHDVPQESAASGDTLTIPEGADSPFYVLFPMTVGQHVQITADTSGVRVRAEDAGGVLDLVNESIPLMGNRRFEPPFDLAPMRDGIYRAVIFAPDDADTFPRETTVTLESLSTYTEEVSFGRHGVTSDRLTTYTVQLDQYEAVRFEMETDYYAWMTIIDPDVGELYRSGHMASGSYSAAHTIVAAEAGPIHVRLSVNSGVTANGTSILTVGPVQTEVLTMGETKSLSSDDNDDLIAVDLEADQSYRIELTAEDDGFVRLFDVTAATAGPGLPLSGMYNIQGTARIWTSETTGRAFFRVNVGESTRLVQLTISEVNE